MAAASIPQEIVPQLAEAGLDLRTYAELWMYAEDSALSRAQDDRAPFAAEMALEARLAGERGRQMASLETVRAVANDYPDAFNAALADALSDETIDGDAKGVFDEGIGVIDGDYASVTVSLCDRSIASLRGEPGSSESTGNGIPPVSGGDSLACDLIVVGGMACGATCIMGCGPCCVGAVAAVVGYASFCS